MAWRWPWPSAAWPAASGPTSACSSGEDPFTTLFGEAPGGFILSGEPAAIERLAANGPVRTIGTVTGDSLRIDLGDSTITASLTELSEAHSSLTDLFP